MSRGRAGAGGGYHPCPCSRPSAPFDPMADDGGDRSEGAWMGYVPYPEGWMNGRGGEGAAGHVRGSGERSGVQLGQRLYCVQARWGIRLGQPLCPQLWGLPRPLLTEVGYSGHQVGYRTSPARSTVHRPVWPPLL